LSKELGLDLGLFNFHEDTLYWNFLENSNKILENYFKEARKTLQINNNNYNNHIDSYEYNYLFDCCNGIAAFLNEKLNKIFSINKDNNIFFYNIDYKNYEFLNEGCGSEFIQKEKNLPRNLLNFLKEKSNENNQDFEYVKNISFDGDIDRIIYL
jgi:phosphomannomutase